MLISGIVFLVRGFLKWELLSERVGEDRSADADVGQSRRRERQLPPLLPAELGVAAKSKPKRIKT